MIIRLAIFVNERNSNVCFVCILLYLRESYEEPSGNNGKVSFLYNLPKDACLRMCVCVFVLCLLLLPSREGRTLALKSESKIDQADFTDWMSFLPSDLM